MTASTQTTSGGWTSVQAYSIAAVCLLAGIGGGWFLRGARATKLTAPPAVSSIPAGPTVDQVKQIADSQAAPLLEQLKSDPKNADVLANLGNLYYDAKQYPTAIDYYKKSLEVRRDQSSVRTDLGTAYWYSGDADSALKEFNRVLETDPNNPNTLFNLGIVRLHGKSDTKGAVEAWQKLLDKNPDYPNKEAVQQLIQGAKGH